MTRKSIFVLCWGLSNAACLLSMSDTVSKDSSQELSKTCVNQYIFCNWTDWKLLVRYGKTKDSMCGATLAPQEKVLIAIPSESTIVEVVPSGKYYQYTQLRHPENLCERLARTRECQKTDSLKITISSSSYLGSLTTPLTFEVDQYSDGEVIFIMPRGGVKGVNKFFGGANCKLEKKIRAFPRHFLRLPHSAIPLNYPHAIEAAYNEAMHSWNFFCAKNGLQVDDQDDSGQSVKRFAEKARDVLLLQHTLKNDSTIKPLLEKGFVLSLEEKVTGLDFDTGYESEIKKIDTYIGNLTEHHEIDSMKRIKKCLNEERQFLQSVYAHYRSSFLEGENIELRGIIEGAIMFGFMWYIFRDFNI